MDYGAGNERVSSRSRVICLFPLPVGSPNTHTYHHENLSVVALFCCHYDNCAPIRPPREGAGLGVKKEPKVKVQIQKPRGFHQNGTGRPSPPAAWRKIAAGSASGQMAHIRREVPPARQPPFGCLDGNEDSPLPNPMQNYIKKFKDASLKSLVYLDLTK